MGHFNVQFYTTKLSEGMAHLAAALGLTEHPGLTLRYQRAFSRYLGELHAGDILDTRAAVLEVDAGRINLLAEIVNGATGRLSATFELYCESYDPATQQAVPWPDALRQKMTALITERTDQPRPPTAGGPVPLRSGPVAEPYISSRGTVAAWDCGTDGQIAPHLYYGISSDGIGHIRYRMGITRDTAQANHWGVAALEFDIGFHAPIGAGDIYTLRSGLLDLGDKTFRFGHSFYNDSNTALAATFDVLGCMFDLKARRAMTIPDEINAQAQDLMIAWPPVN